MEWQPRRLAAHPSQPGMQYSGPPYWAPAMQYVQPWHPAPSKPTSGYRSTSKTSSVAKAWCHRHQPPRPRIQVAGKSLAKAFYFFTHLFPRHRFVHCYVRSSYNYGRSGRRLAPAAVARSSVLSNLGPAAGPAGGRAGHARPSAAPATACWTGIYTMRC